MITITMPTWFTVLMVIWFVSGFVTWIIKLVIAETDAKQKEAWRKEMRTIMGLYEEATDEEVATDCSWKEPEDEE